MLVGVGEGRTITPRPRLAVGVAATRTVGLVWAPTVGEGLGPGVGSGGSVGSGTKVGSSCGVGGRVGFSGGLSCGTGVEKIGNGEMAVGIGIGVGGGTAVLSSSVGGSVTSGDSGTVGAGRLVGRGVGAGEGIWTAGSVGGSTGTSGVTGLVGMACTVALSVLTPCGGPPAGGGANGVGAKSPPCPPAPPATGVPVPGLATTVGGRPLGPSYVGMGTVPSTGVAVTTVGDAPIVAAGVAVAAGGRSGGRGCWGPQALAINKVSPIPATSRGSSTGLPNASGRWPTPWRPALSRRSMISAQWCQVERAGRNSALGGAASRANG